MDIYQSTYSYLDSKTIAASSARIFKVNVSGNYLGNNPSNFMIFNHIGQTGGVQLNDVVSKDSGKYGYKFLIPNFNTYKDKNIYKDEKLFLSGHFLNGVDEHFNSSSSYFTLLRDPVSLVMSVLTSKEDFLSNTKVSAWDMLMRKLEFWEKEVGHLNLQTFEIAINHQNKRYGFIPETSLEVPTHNYKNYIGTNSNNLLIEAKKQIANKYLMVGITELYEETLFLLYARLGFETISLWRPGIFSFWRPKRFEIPAFVENKIKQLTTADHTLYFEYRAKLESDFFSADFGSEFIDYKLLSRNHELRLYLEFSERIQLGEMLYSINKDSIRFKEEISHVIEFRNAMDELISKGLNLSMPVGMLKNIVNIFEKRALKKKNY